MLTMSLPWWEFLVRAFVVYFFLLIALRLTGKRQIGQLAPFDLVLLLVLSNAVQNSMNGGDNSLLGGLLIALTLVALNYLMGLFTYSNKTAQGLVEGHPKVLIHNGKIFDSIMKQEMLSRRDLDAAIRQAGLIELGQVQFAVLENSGHISIIAHKPHPLPDNPQPKT